MNNEILSGEVLDDLTELSLSELCHACSSHAEWILELVDEGIIEPIGCVQHQWKFSALNLQKARTATRLQRDLNINLAGVALALDLLDEIETLRLRLRHFEK